MLLKRHLSSLFHLAQLGHKKQAIFDSGGWTLSVLLTLQIINGQVPHEEHFKRFEVNPSQANFSATIF